MAKHFHDEEAAREYLERIRWPNGPVCPFCGGTEKNAAYGPSMGTGWYQCGDCRGKFTVRVGTVYERSHIPLHKWVHATHLMNASKKGISAHQLHRMLGITYKSAWFMAHRIREAMAPHAGSMEPMGGNRKTVEIDETYVGGKDKNKHAHLRKNRPGKDGKEIVFSLVERKGRVRSHHVADVTASTLRPILLSQIKRGTVLMSDEGATVRPDQARDRPDVG